ncbi:MAG: radical SAM protein [Elusimicrobia bacterium]|nr:radical SAM protein [Elusimicrobiota bacterium]
MTSITAAENAALNKREIAQGKLVLESCFQGLGAALTSRCNIDCIMCPRWKPDWDIPEKTAGEIYEHMPLLGRVYWQGGEVFLSKYFKKLYERACEFPGLRQELATSGLLIDRSWAERLVKARINLIFSIDGVTKGTYERIRRGAGFGDLLNSLALVKDARSRFEKESGGRAPVTTSMNFVVMRSNFGELRGAADFAFQHGFDDLTVTALHEFSHFDGYEKENIFDSGDREITGRIAADVAYLRKTASEKGMDFHCWLPVGQERSGGGDTGKRAPERRIFCLWPWQHLFIDMGGRVKPNCICPVEVGNIHDNSLIEIWNNDMMIEYRRRIIGRNCRGFCNNNCLSNMEREELYRMA